MIKRRILFLTISFIIALITVLFLRINNNNYPVAKDIYIGNEKYKLHFPVEHIGNSHCLIEFPINDTLVNGKMHYRDIRKDKQWQTIKMVHMNHQLNSLLPAKTPNSRIVYYISLNKDDVTYILFKEKPIFLNYKIEVPDVLYYSFYILVFICIFFSCFTGFYAAFNFYALKKYTLITFWLFLITGLVLGPLNQLIAIHFDLKAMLYSFDLFIIKIFAAFLLWWIAYSLFKRFNFRWGIVAASILTFIMLLIPYSVFVK